MLYNFKVSYLNSRGVLCYYTFHNHKLDALPGLVDALGDGVKLLNIKIV